MKMNVESFNLDHTKVKAPYVRIADRKKGVNGDLIVKYDVRFKRLQQRSHGHAKPALFRAFSR